MDKEIEIIKNLLRVAKKEVIIFEHSKQWNLLTAVVKWFEGSYYDVFIKTDFTRIAENIRCKKFEEGEIDNVRILHFFK